MERQVWLFLPSDALRELSSTKDAMADACAATLCKHVVRYTERHRAPGGRPLPAVRVEDAANLYRSVHRAHVGVLVIGDVLVRRDPSQAPALSPRSRHLIDFVRHKAHCEVVAASRFGAAVATFLAAFLQWCTRVECEGEQDPRCLPMHTFEADPALPSLHTEEGRSRFAARHGSPTHRIDTRGLHWEPDGERHGRDVLHVAGRELPRGSHWDITPERASSRVFTAHEVWRVDPEGHLNVYADSYVRQGTRSSREWP
jgi:hypothetical protein